MPYIEFHSIDDSKARKELFEVLADRQYEDIPIIGKTDQNWLVEGVIYLDGDNTLKFHHENDHDPELGNIVEWTYAENPDTKG